MAGEEHNYVITVKQSMADRSNRRVPMILSGLLWLLDCDFFCSWGGGVVQRRLSWSIIMHHLEMLIFGCIH